MRCPYCGKMNVYVHARHSTEIKDFPFLPKHRQSLVFYYHGYKCRECGHHFMEPIPAKVPNARITIRAAEWIKGLLSRNMPVSAVAEITGFHWETVKKIHLGFMDEFLRKRKEELHRSGYKPTYLAVDEFAIHKGHSYASCVMDLETGEILWVGQGRGMEDFRKFFKEYDMERLNNVKAFAMDMNASFNRLVEEYMPKTEIVYDRYHMQAQYGKDVLGSVRLEEARKHQDKSNELKKLVGTVDDKETLQKLKQEIRNENQGYTRLKKARWAVLTNSRNLSESGGEALDEILNSHSDLATCYAMKEEMNRLFELRDKEKAYYGWMKWFLAAEESGIPQLQKFAKLKVRRLKGLVAHATHPISTGKLEDTNNKIKVAKRIAFGYRDQGYFFTLIRYQSSLGLPTIP
ncbi:ISL3 family transposase [uncultured Ruminobacter sp.]|uniref:ISL3 family transposase n=2 Tax=Ruminobacter TaxID=866 RepID=UPI0025F5DBE8|nr:ISL3 family transposase [uncultured Ruminobacter sp.]